MPLWVEILAVVVGSTAGMVAARRHVFDLVGVVALAITTGLGGGILRDILLQHGPPVALTRHGLVIAAVAVGLIGGLAPIAWDAMGRAATLALVVLDALFLGIYAILSATKALELGLPATPCILVGVIGGVGGAVLRDVFLNEKPQVFVPGTLYAVPTAIAVTAYVLLVRALELGPWIAAPCIAGVIVLRLLAHELGWTLPEASRDVLRITRIRRHVTSVLSSRRRDRP
jgi:uncharacterized membrane protein YeiH